MSQQRALRITAWLAALAVIALPLVAAMNGWLASDRWPFRELIVNGAFEHVSIEQIRAQALPVLKSGYFAVDLDQVRARVSTLPWVEHVDVRKRWPDRIEITINEREAFAKWGSDLLLSTRGDLFAVPGGMLPMDLPVFNGPKELRLVLSDFYRNALTVLAPIGLAPSGITLSNRGAWMLNLSNGAELVLGREQAEQRLSRFAEVYQELTNADISRLQRADLRYENGFALRWAPLVPEPETLPNNTLPLEAAPTPSPNPTTPAVVVNEPAQT